MGDLSKNFSRSEFECRCGCGMRVIDAELVKVLEEVREAFGGKRITITSGNRCYAHNLKIGGAENSKHTQSIAADFKVEGVNPPGVYEWIDARYPDSFGLGKYNGWTHLDVRKGKGRWDKT